MRGRELQGKGHVNVLVIFRWDEWRLWLRMNVRGEVRLGLCVCMHAQEKWGVGGRTRSVSSRERRRAHKDTRTYTKGREDEIQCTRIHVCAVNA